MQAHFITLKQQPVLNCVKSTFKSQTPTLIKCPYGEFEIGSVRIVSDKTSTFRIWFLDTNVSIASDVFNTSKVKGWVDLTGPVTGGETVPLFHLGKNISLPIKYNGVFGRDLPILIQNTGAVNDCDIWIEITINAKIV